MIESCLTISASVECCPYLPEGSQLENEAKFERMNNLFESIPGFFERVVELLNVKAIEALSRAYVLQDLCPTEIRRTEEGLLITEGKQGETDLLEIQMKGRASRVSARLLRSEFPESEMDIDYLSEIVEEVEKLNP